MYFHDVPTVRGGIIESEEIWQAAGRRFQLIHDEFRLILSFDDNVNFIFGADRLPLVAALNARVWTQE
jgi:hypothetical protein